MSTNKKPAGRSKNPAKPSTSYKFKPILAKKRYIPKSQIKNTKKK